MTNEYIQTVSERYIELYENILGEKFVKADISNINDSEIGSNKFIDSPKTIKKIIRNKNIKTTVVKDGNKIKVSIPRKNK